MPDEGPRLDAAGGGPGEEFLRQSETMADGCIGAFLLPGAAIFPTPSMTRYRFFGRTESGCYYSQCAGVVEDPAMAENSGVPVTQYPEFQ